MIWDQQCRRYGDVAKDIIHDMIHPPTAWGAWRHDAERGVITHASSIGYEVPVSEITTADSLVDWIFQLQGKTWLTDEDMRQFLAAIDDLLRPQATLVHKDSKEN